MKKYSNASCLLALLIAGIGSLSLHSCIKDNGNYEFAENNLVSIQWDQSISLFVGDSLNYAPRRTFLNQADSIHFSHAWYINGKLHSEEPNLKFLAKEFGGFGAKYYMTDKRTGVVYTNNDSPPLNVSIQSPFSLGWAVLYADKNGNSEIAHVVYDANKKKYMDYTGLYQQANGHPMGTNPFKIYPYSMRGTRAVFAVQHAGQGALDLNGLDYTRKLVASKAFTREVPDNLQPIDFANFNAADLFVNADGSVYGRFFNGAAAFTIPWMSTPMTVEKGMKVKEIWDAWYKTSNIAIMYDYQNKRLLQADGTRFYQNGGIEIKAMPAPAIPYPGDYTPLDNFGDWEYVWGSVFIESYMNITGGMVLRSPLDRKYYFQNFDFTTLGPKLTPRRRIPLLGQEHMDDKTQFLAIKNRNYLFFSGNNGKNLYFFDVETGAQTRLYQSFSSSITTLALNDDTFTIAVGLEDGQVILYDINTAILNAGQSKELHRLQDLGRVAHIMYKGYKI